MDIKDFVSQFETHPVLFVGSGLSRRYLQNAPDWNELLINIAVDIWGDDSKFLELSERHNFDPSLIAGDFESFFRQEIDTNTKFSDIKRQHQNNIRGKSIVNPFKLYLASIFSKLEYRQGVAEELSLLKNLNKSIKSIVTTNYDGMLEDLFNFDKLVGNDIMLSRQYGTIYKMHGCYTDPAKIIFTYNDYTCFKEQNKLIISQLISLFIHSPVIFLGYGADDPNVNSVLETIYYYIGNNQALRNKVKNNFLLVEYVQGSQNTKITGYDNTLPSGVHLSLHKLETDDYVSVYNAISDSPCAIEAGILRLVDNLMERVFINSKDKKNAKIINYFFDDINGANPSDLVLGVLNKKDVDQVKASVVYKDKIVAATPDDFIINYFDIIDKKERSTIKVIDSLQPKISNKHYFPVFAFTEIVSTSNLKDSNRLKDIQEKKLNEYVTKIKKNLRKHSSLDEILEDINVKDTQKDDCIIMNIWNGSINLSQLEEYLRNYKEDKKSTSFRRLITLYDYMRYGNTVEAEEEGIDD